MSYKGHERNNEDEKTRVIVTEIEDVDEDGTTRVLPNEIMKEKMEIAAASSWWKLEENMYKVRNTQVKVKDFNNDSFVILNRIVDEDGIDEEETEDDDMYEHEMKLWRLVDEKEIRRKYAKEKTNKHRQVGRNRKHKYKWEMDMNEGSDENNETKEYLTDKRDDEGLRSDIEGAEEKPEADIGAAVEDKENCAQKIRKELEERVTKAMELARGDINNDKKDDLWIQFTAIEQEWKDTFAGMQTDGTTKDAKMKIIVKNQGL
ncbi:hypothetical protein SUGI_1165910 [Cryptomeria japonica]|nr:hypothetical protein SUGI_1165910 [Cryptomeria japonica]